MKTKRPEELLLVYLLLAIRGGVYAYFVYLSYNILTGFLVCTIIIGLLLLVPHKLAYFAAWIAYAPVTFCDLVLVLLFFALPNLFSVFAVACSGLTVYSLARAPVRTYFLAH